jgi:hypothetical protein
MTNDSLLWQFRHFVYSHFADTTRPPDVDETARHFNIPAEEAGEIYKDLHNRHAFFLEPGTLTVRMAWPFSAIPTDFKVQADGKTYYANCAWDMLGIPVVLQTNAVLEAVCTESNESAHLEVRDGQITNLVATRGARRHEGSLPPTSETLRPFGAQSDILLIHFPLPFARWYDDLVFT